MWCRAQRALPTFSRVDNIPYSFLLILESHIHVSEDIKLHNYEARQEDNSPVEELGIKDTLPIISSIVFIISLFLEHLELAPEYLSDIFCHGFVVNFAKSHTGPHHSVFFRDTQSEGS